MIPCSLIAKLNYQVTMIDRFNGLIDGWVVFIVVWLGFENVSASVKGEL